MTACIPSDYLRWGYRQMRSGATAGSGHDRTVEIDGGDEGGEALSMEFAGDARVRFEECPCRPPQWAKELPSKLAAQA
jgi:hypothetical protein